MKPGKLSKDISIGQFDEKWYGTEPTWVENKKYTRTDIIRAMNWYNYALDDELRFGIVLTQVSDKEDIRAIKALNSSQLKNSFVSLCRMKQRGIPKKFLDEYKFEAKLKEALDLGRLNIQESKSSSKPISIQARVENSAGKYIADLEDELDLFYNNNYNSEFKCYEWLDQRKIKPMIAIALADYYRPLLVEVKLAVSKTDKDITSGYAKKSKAALGRYITFLERMIKDCEKWSSNKRAQKPRKPRTKKAVTAEKLVAKIKFQKEDTELKLVSIDPAKIVGSSEAWLYNTKYRMLQHYVATDRGGLKVKGTTIVDFDKTQSEARKIRKPEIVGSFLTGGARAVLKQFKTLNVKPVVCNGRVNEFTLILRVIK